MPGKKANNNSNNMGAKGISKSAKKRKRKQQQQQMQTQRVGTMAAAARMATRFAGVKNEERLLAMAMGLPGEIGALRFPTKDAPRTAVMGALDQRTITTADSTAGGWGNGDLLIAFFGQPGRLAMVYSVLANPSYYYLLMSSPTGVARRDWYITNNNIAGSVSINTPWPLLATEQGTGATVHGKTMAVGMSGGHSYVWLNGNGDKISIQSSTGSSNLVGKAVFEVHQWTGTESSIQVSTVELTLVAGLIPTGTLYAPTSPGYYRIEFAEYLITSGASTSNMAIQLRLTLDSVEGWTQISMGDLDANASGDASIGEQVRVNASSMLLTNTTSVLNRQGTVLAARVKSNDFMFVTPASLGKSAEKYTGDAALGCYTFKEFSRYSEEFRNVTLSDQAKGVVFDLDMDDFFHFIQVTCPNVSTTANTYTLSFYTMLEFKTDVARYQKDVSNLNEMSLIAARRLVNSRPEWFYENPLHAGQIYQFVKNLGYKAARGAATAAPYVAKAASFYNPAGAAGYEALAQMLRGLIMR